MSYLIFDIIFLLIYADILWISDLDQKRKEFHTMLIKWVTLPSTFLLDIDVKVIIEYYYKIKNACLFRTMPSNNEKKLKKFKSSRTYLIPQTFALSIIQSHKIIFPTMPEINLFWSATFSYRWHCWKPKGRFDRFVTYEWPINTRAVGMCYYRQLTWLILCLHRNG